jgi:serine/threonine protein kinase
LIFDIL